MLLKRDLDPNGTSHPTESAFNAAAYSFVVPARFDPAMAVAVSLPLQGRFAIGFAERRNDLRDRS